MTDTAHRILIVDHDPVACQSLSMVLRDRGYDVATALNASEALDALERAQRPAAAAPVPPRPFDLVISELILPGMKARELL
jgi:CheY-like chemotaxis protein